VNAPAELLLSVKDLNVTFATDEGVVHAVNGVSFDIGRGEVLGIVGESGSGKSVTSMAVMGLLPSTATVTGSILWRGQELVGAGPEVFRKVRAAQIAMIFQDPLSALNPVLRIGDQVGESLRHHQGLSRRAAGTKAVELLRSVGIPQPERRARSYPHEFSGGMRQRAMIAMAIACDPDLLFADEPTTALDVTVQAQVLELLTEVQDRLRSAIVLITHDLGVVAGMADRVLVMYAGRPVEVGEVDNVFARRFHPYTSGLLSSLPRIDQDGEELTPIKGAPPSMLRVPSGCAFHPRCPHAQVGQCDVTVPPLRELAGRHFAACLFAEDLAADRGVML
jgi:peptide/nickel transport system ATP-binding protein